MRRTSSAALLALVLAAVLPAASRAVVIEVRGDAPPELRRGIEFGLAETRQTAQLLGVDVRIAQNGDGGGPVHGIIVASPGEPASPGVPALHVGPLPTGAGGCDFSIAVPPGHADAGTVVRWHPSLNRFGASELNERFSSRYAAPMGDLAWAGWVAMKALVESALRHPDAADPCAALAGLRFDGHKGRPLRFDPQTRILSQPLYTVKNDRVVGESK